MNKHMISLFALAATAFVGTAHAQTYSDGSVDAIATLEATSLPLSVTGQSALSFGTVNLPNGTQAGHSCQYSVGASSTPYYALRELDGNGSSVDTSAPTASSCDWGSGGTPSGALSEFTVACNPATPVDYTAYVSAAGVQGVDVYYPYTGSILGLFNENGTLLQASASYSYTITNHVCPANGQVTVRVGASLIVDETASAATELTVGTLTLEASY